VLHELHVAVPQPLQSSDELLSPRSFHPRNKLEQSLSKPGSAGHRVRSSHQAALVWRIASGCPTKFQKHIGEVQEIVCEFGPIMLARILEYHLGQLIRRLEPSDEEAVGIDD
jgi:hypothetical protein